MQLGEATALGGRHRHDIDEAVFVGEFFEHRQQFCLLLDLIDLVHRQNAGYAGFFYQAQSALVFITPARCFDHQQHQIDAQQRTAGGTIHIAIDRSPTARVQAGRVGEQDLPRFAGGYAENAMASGLRSSRNDADAKSDQGIDDARLAHVGAADHRHGTALERASGFLFHRLRRGGCGLLFCRITVLTHSTSPNCSSSRAAAACSAARRLLPQPSACKANSGSRQAAVNSRACSSPRASMTS